MLDHKAWGSEFELVLSGFHVSRVSEFEVMWSQNYHWSISCFYSTKIVVLCSTIVCLKLYLQFLMLSVWNSSLRNLKSYLSFKHVVLLFQILFLFVYFLTFSLFYLFSHFWFYLFILIILSILRNTQKFKEIIYKRIFFYFKFFGNIHEIKM